jgi:hypothetical protein
MTTRFAEFVAASLKSEKFTLVDIGCAGGLDPGWRIFGSSLRAIGFDASISECRRLEEAEENPDVIYIPGFVDLPASHPRAERHRGKPDLVQSTFRRLSAAWAFELRRERLKTASPEEKRDHNAWAFTELADASTRLFVPDVLKEKGIKDVDFLKIDIDGPDFKVLNSFDGLLDDFRIMALRLEVNFHGTAEDHVHSFHNTDRFMRERGFDLFGLDTRTYSVRALPSRFATTAPAQTETGRIFQGDAFYARDAASTYQREPAASFGGEKLAKLAAIFSILKQPDSAAEVLVTFRDVLAPLLDVDMALDLLAIQAQPDVEEPLTYERYLALFASDSPEFYPRPYIPPPEPPPVTLRRRLSTALRAFSDPNGAFSPESKK